MARDTGNGFFGESMDLSELTGDERIIAEHAVLTYREVRQATQAAAPGQGMAATESMLNARGLETLRKMFELSVSEHAEAQKKGSAAKYVRAATR